jgi:hypothetical protein
MRGRRCTTHRVMPEAVIVMAAHVRPYWGHRVIVATDFDTTSHVNKKAGGASNGAECG